MGKRSLVAVIFILLILLGWSPWLKKEDAQEKTIKVFEEKWKDTMDGCGFNCQGCGVTSSKKIPFGYLVRIQYKCGMKDYFQQGTYFVSFLKTPLQVN